MGVVGFSDWRSTTWHRNLGFGNSLHQILELWFMFRPSDGFRVLKTWLRHNHCTIQSWRLWHSGGTGGAVCLLGSYSVAFFGILFKDRESVSFLTMLLGRVDDDSFGCVDRSGQKKDRWFWTCSTHSLVFVPSPYSYDDDTIHRSNAYSHLRACVTVVGPWVWSFLSSHLESSQQEAHGVGWEPELITTIHQVVE